MVAAVMMRRTGHWGGAIADEEGWGKGFLPAASDSSGTVRRPDFGRLSLHQPLRSVMFCRRGRGRGQALAMHIKSISYSEWPAEPRYWELTTTQFRDFDLITGKNATGKSRILAIINSLAQIVTKKVAEPLSSGHWQIEFLDAGSTYRYELSFINKEVLTEEYSRNGVVLIQRNQHGEGSIFSEDLRSSLKFKVPNTEIVSVTRRDTVQHPFLEPLHEWARNIRMVPFGTSLGRDQLILSQNMSEQGKQSKNPSIDPASVVQLISAGEMLFGRRYIENILSDFRHIGYDCEDLGSEEFRDIEISGFVPKMLFVKEKDLNCSTRQIEMSQGMFRALALLINLHFCLFAEIDATILIDDIGEGLDFSRSVALIEIIIERTTDAKIQLIMTTNDRFIMNAVDLSHWQLASRNGHVLQLLNAENSPALFSEFEYTGLSNFDFFAQTTDEVVT